MSDVCNIDLTWAVETFGSIARAIDEAEIIAAQYLEHDENSGLDWASHYIASARDKAHIGDCPLARSWQRGPVTCVACVYDEYMAKAWAALELETKNPPA